VTPVLETPRLLLRPTELADAAQVQILFAKWEVVRYLTARVPWPYPPDGAESFYRDVVLPGVARGEKWDWTLRLKTEPDRIIGGLGLGIGDENRGFWIDVPWRGRGLMTEACNVATAFWFETLGFARLRVSKAAANLPSRRISERQGMRLIATEEKDYVSGRLPSEIWEITAEEWRALREDLGAVQDP
jgi:RimJ/RimL family protein N-acetyltransferase